MNGGARSPKAAGEPMIGVVNGDDEDEDIKDEKGAAAMRPRAFGKAAALLASAAVAGAASMGVPAALVPSMKEALALAWISRAAFIGGASGVGAGAGTVLALIGVRCATGSWSLGVKSQVDGGYAPLPNGDDDGGQRKGIALRLLVSLCIPDIPLLLLAFAFLIGAAIASACVPAIIGDIIDVVTQADGGGPRHDAEFRRRLLYLVAAGLVGAVCTALRGGIFTYSMGLQNVRVRRWLFESLCRQDISFFDGTKVGDLLSRLTSDTTRISDSISLNINVLLRCIVSACIVLGFMMYVNGRLTLICLSAMPVVTVMAKYYGAYVKKLSKQTQEEVAASNVCAEEVLSNMRTVRSLNGEKQAAYEFEDRLNNYTSMNTRQSIAYSLLAFLYTLLPTLVTLLLLLEGGKLVMRNELSSGKLFTFMLYQVSLSSSFNVIADVFTSFSSALGSAQKVAELIDTDETEHLEGAFAPERVVGRLELRNVTFRYPTRREVAALDGLSVAVEAGKSLALVGPSGGGKSSCIQLIKRFYEPEYGAVMLDGKNLRSYSDKFVHEHIALVSQEPVLFNRSILDNILYGLKVGCDCDADGGGDGGEPSMPTMEDVHAAARLANAHDFIIGLPMGYATVCGDKGVSLSGGQKQRIAIARALVRKPTVLLLDEATSALDSESEHTVQKAIDRLMERSTCTVVLIAHRLSTVRNADQIAYIEGGKCHESGTPAELLDKPGGMYAALVKRQMSAPMT